MLSSSVSCFILWVAISIEFNAKNSHFALVVHSKNIRNYRKLTRLNHFSESFFSKIFVLIDYEVFIFWFRNKNVVQAMIAVLLATLVALLGYMLLSRNYFYDFWLFVLCFVIAKCQFSLLKVSSLTLYHISYQCYIYIETS